MNHPDQLATRIFETTTNDQVPSCNQNLQKVGSILGTDPTADCNSPLNVDGYGHDYFSSESEFPENLFIVE